MATRAIEPDDPPAKRERDEVVSERIVDLDSGQVAEVTSLGDISIVRRLEVPSRDPGKREPRSRAYAYTPRRARPPWTKPDVLVLGDDLPNYLRAERTFHALTESGLLDLLEAPAWPNGARSAPPIIAIPNASPNGFGPLMDRLEQRGIPVLPLRNIVQERCRLAFLEDEEAEPEVRRQPHWRRAALRIFDLVVGLLGCLAFAVALPFLAAAILIEDGRPIFYVQHRICKGGRTFRLLKFRSMTKDAEEAGPTWATLNDERVTRVGAVMRRYKLDELPQFLNVVRGHMSVVGPRPERPMFAETLRKLIPHYDLRHAVRPGLTGWGTLRVGYGNSIEAKYLTHQYDLYHLRHRTVRFDLEIMARSFFAIMLRPERQDRFML